MRYGAVEHQRGPAFRSLWLRGARSAVSRASASHGYFFAKSSVAPSYDRVFQTPAMENLLLASSPQLDSVNPVVLRLPVPVARANYYEGGIH